MRKDVVENLKVKDLKHVLLPLKRGRMLKDCVDIGFDTEFTSEDNSAERELISLQFSLGRGKTRIYYVNKREGISSEELLKHVLRFLNEMDVEPRRHLYLISHFAIAELSRINDFYDEYVAEGGYKVRPKVSEFNKAIRWEKQFSDITLHINDLFGHMKTSLEKIGESLGFEKLKIEVEGKGHEYWITHMKELSEKHRDVFNAYAIRDAEVAIEAWKALLREYEPLSLDPHLYTTFTSLAVAAFRRQMRHLPCRTQLEPVLTKQRMKRGEWREHMAKKVVYEGDLNVRVIAALSYWGGNNQAFIRGYYPDVEGSYYDFISLYIISGILQPLSNEHTKYKRLTLKDVAEGYEGFCEVAFEFPEDEKYPCLPVQENYYPKLMFPLKGLSCCTCTEVREALKANVKISNFRGYGFYSSENEVEHDLKPFLLNMLKKKTELDERGLRKSIEREILKAHQVGMIGRLAYMRPSRTVEDITRLLHESSLKISEFREYGKKRALRELTSRSEVGGTWHIEWASLILGKSRSLASQVVRSGEKCLAISTDGGFWLGDPKFEESELHKQLRSYYSGIRLEGRFDELWIARNRVYVAWNKGEVLHSAMMGITVPGRSSDEKKRNFEAMIRHSLSEGREVYSESEMTRLTGLNDFLYDGIPLNSVQVKTRKISWKPDFKRKLVHEVNVFKDYTDTRPYETVEEAFREVYGIRERPGRPKRIKPAGRPKVLTKQQIEEVKKDLTELTIAEVTRKYHVSVSTIKRISRALS